ncbi:hypothetical protein THAOC_30726 [Thalassiosira oceanica]|uniref:Uncharacterized protein n=1 Tax=Thalassiosira oceanica TaxID=159749 RepID=K0R9Q0_THAOC|nr:hypothetical protein THAOC_30726 [Thalassiosira oceanica]|eukprot:EJK50323.1 hypothetical protein THAOC_30726 [Thalassiosira oceanica]
MGDTPTFLIKRVGKSSCLVNWRALTVCHACAPSCFYRSGRAGSGRRGTDGRRGGRRSCYLPRAGPTRASRASSYNGSSEAGEEAGEPTYLRTTGAQMVQSSTSSHNPPRRGRGGAELDLLRLLELGRVLAGDFVAGVLQTRERIAENCHIRRSFFEPAAVSKRVFADRSQGQHFFETLLSAKLQPGCLSE